MIEEEKVPKFAVITRHHIPKEGVITLKPSRVKARVKKALDKAGIQSEALRGIGRRVGNFMIIYTERGEKLLANFERYDENKLPKRTAKSRKQKRTMMFPGRHPSTIHFAPEVFVAKVLELLPNDWTEQETNAHRWLSTDMSILLQSGYDVESSAKYLEKLAQKTIKGPIDYTIIETDGSTLIGIGPV